MNRYLSSTIVAATLCLPATLFAIETGTAGNQTELSQDFTNLETGLITNGAQPGTDSTGSVATDTEKNFGGVMVHDGAAYIVHRLQSEMSLPDGSRIEPNGTILGRDGSSKTVNSGQMLTLDGQITAAPFGLETGQSRTTTPPLSLDTGIDTGTTPGSFNPGVPPTPSSGSNSSGQSLDTSNPDYAE